MKVLMKGMLILMAVHSGISHCNAQEKDSIVSNHQKMDVRTLVGKVGPNIIEQQVPVMLIVNGFVLKDTARARALIRSLKKTDYSYRYYDAKDGRQKWGITSEHGFIYCETKKNILIDYGNLSIIKK